MIESHETNLWYVVRTKPRRELMVLSLLEAATELTLFLPEVWQPSTTGRRLTPLFPGYLFVQVALTSPVAGVLVHTPGVIGFVSNNHRPTPVATPVVQALQAKVAAINAQGGLVSHVFRAGDPVVVKAGPLQGLDAIFVRPLTPAQRVQILLHFLGRQQTVTVDADLLEQSKPHEVTPSTHRPRRTRGHGRQIRAMPASLPDVKTLASF